jgi:hypothetical protein
MLHGETVISGTVGSKDPAAEETPKANEVCCLLCKRSIVNIETTKDYVPET